MTRTPTKTDGFIIYNRLPLAGLPPIARMGGKEPRVRHKNPQWADDYPYNRGFLWRTCEKEHNAVMTHRSPSYLMVSVSHVSVLNRNLLKIWQIREYYLYLQEQILTLCHIS